MKIFSKSDGTTVPLKSIVDTTGTIAYMMKDSKKIGRMINFVCFDLEVKPAYYSEAYRNRYFKAVAVITRKNE